MNMYRIALCCVIVLLAMASPAFGDLVGQPAPPLHIAAWIKGAPANIFDGQRIYVVEFWATWCSPCRAVFPHLSALQDTYGDRVQIVAISDEAPSLVAPFVADQGAAMDYTVACDVNDQTFAAYGLEYIPWAFVVGPDGRVTWQGNSYDLDDPLQAAVATFFRFTQQPAGKWLEEDSPITFQVAVAGGSGPYHYAWYKNGAPKSWVPIGDDAPVYTIEHVTDQDSGSYYCVATDGSGKASIASQTTILTVFAEGALPAPHGIALFLLSVALIAAAWAAACARYPSADPRNRKRSHENR